MTNPTTPLPVQEPAGAVEALSDSAYLLALIDETFASVPQVKAHHERMRKIAATLASLQPVTQAKSEAVARAAEEVKYAQVKVADETVNYGRNHERTIAERVAFLACVDRLASLAAPQEAVERQPLTETTCEWSQDGNEDGLWFSACGGAPWYFESDDPTKNGMRFCIHCGNRMVQHGIGPATQEKP